MSVRALFSDEDLDRIRAAVTSAEATTSGEIVPYLVGRVDDHDEARWRGATLGALAAALAVGVVHQLGLLWMGEPIVWMSLPALVGAGLGFVVSGVPTVHRWLLTDDDVERRVRLRAEAAFLEEEVFRTRNRTGILLFIAFFEHRALVLADEGIYRVVPEGSWDDLVATLVGGIRAGRTPEAICEAIERCGALLEEHRVLPQSDDTDELESGLRFEET